MKSSCRPVPRSGQSFDNDKKFSSVVTAQGKVTRAIYMTPTGRSSLEVATNYFDAVAAEGFTPVFQCSGDACGESFVSLKYSWDNPTAKVTGANYEQLRNLMIDAAFESLIDVRYTLFKKTEADGDTYVAIYAGLNNGTGFGTYSDAWKRSGSACWSKSSSRGPWTAAWSWSRPPISATRSPLKAARCSTGSSLISTRPTSSRNPRRSWPKWRSSSPPIRRPRVHHRSHR